MAEGNFKKLQERCEMAKAYVNKFIERKNDRIQQLKDQRHQISEARKLETTRVGELEQILKTKEEEDEDLNN